MLFFKAAWNMFATVAPYMAKKSDFSFVSAGRPARVGFRPGMGGLQSPQMEPARPGDLPSSLTSEGVTIAAEPLFTDALAAQVFDKNDMVTRGIMPLAIVIFNDNDFPIEVDGMTAELIHEAEHTRTMTPNEVVYRLFKKDKSWISRQIPRVSKSELNEDALDDFDQKFLMSPVIAPHDKGGGFLYLHIAGGKDPGRLSVEFGRLHPQCLPPR